jgi:hypothetical protein
MNKLLASTLALVFATAGVASAEPPPGFEPVPSTVAVSSISAPDPVGGLPWGLRTFELENGMVCSQVGRLQDGKIGRVDDNGVWTESDLLPNGCGGPPSADIPGAAKGWGMTLAILNPADGNCSLPGEQGNSRPACVDMRSVYYGEMGTRLTRLTVADPDGSNLRDVPFTPAGEYVIPLNGTFTLVNGPRITAYFSGGCDGSPPPLAGEGWPGRRVENCEWVFPLDGPRPQPESAASKGARRDPNQAKAKITVSRRVAKRGSRISVRFRVPITIREGEGYGVSITGPAACRKQLAQAQSTFTQDYLGMVEGKDAEIRLPLGGKQTRWCRGDYKVKVTFGTHQKQRVLPGTAKFTIR